MTILIRFHLLNVYFCILCGIVIIKIDGVLQGGIQPLYHWRLCNNGDEDANLMKTDPIAKQYNASRCSLVDNTPISCDSRKLPKESCKQASVLLYLPSSSGHVSFPANTAAIAINRHTILPTLQDIFTALDAQNDIRRINITFPSKLHKAVSLQLDDFLTPRLWLQIDEETHPWSLSDNLYIVIERVSHTHEGYLTWLSDIQFPTEMLCKTRYLAICTQTSIHPGWGSVIGDIVEYHERALFSPVAMYVSSSNAPQDNAQFISGINCPDEINKWNCAFLPVFNCTLPDIITKCHTPNCVQDVHFSMVSNSSANGQLVKEGKDQKLRDYLSSTQNSPPSAKNAELWTKANLPPPIYRLSIHNTTKIRDAHNVHYGIQLHNFLFRFNSLYRSLIDLTFRSLELRDNIRLADFGHSEQCVAVHIRRGDRINYEKSIVEHCKENPDDNDRACGSKVRFADVDLPMVIKHAEQMLTGPSRHLFVATDDPKWLEEHITKLDEKLNARWKVHFLPWEHAYATAFSSTSAEEKHKTYYHMRSQAGTQSGVHFFASLKLMQHCDGFIGHFGSAVSWMIHNMMCQRHGQFSGVCPPTHDFHDHGL